MVSVERTSHLSPLLPRGQRYSSHLAEQVRSSTNAISSEKANTAQSGVTLSNFAEPRGGETLRGLRKVPQFHPCAIPARIKVGKPFKGGRTLRKGDGHMGLAERSPAQHLKQMTPTYPQGFIFSWDSQNWGL